MWFKNIHVYRFCKPFELSPEDLSEQLQSAIFQPCNSQDLFSRGWVSPMGDLGSDLVHAANGYIMICSRHQEKVMPAASVNELLTERVVEIEANEARKIGRKERSNLKEEIIFDMLPKAFTRSRNVHAYIAIEEGLLIINTSSTTKAEDLCTDLRQTLGSLSVIPLQGKNPAAQIMTVWLKNRTTAKGFEFGHECEMRDTLDDKSVIRCKHHELDSALINQHVQEGMYVKKLGLCLSSGLNFQVDDNLVVRGIDYGEVVEERARDSDGVDAAAQFDIDFSIMTLELSALIKLLLEAFSVPSIEEASSGLSEQVAEAVA